MEINHIFGNLYSFKFEDQKYNEYHKAFDEWTDAETLKVFFEIHERDLKSGFYKGVEVNDAIMSTIVEAYDFEEVVEHHANAGSLDSIFTDLDKKLLMHQDLTKKKAYGVEYHSWLRLYAIKVDYIYLITGSAIKLTKTMNERHHTQLELNKIERCKAYLKEQGAWDAEAIKEMES